MRPLYEPRGRPWPFTPTAKARGNRVLGNTDHQQDGSKTSRTREMDRRPCGKQRRCCRLCPDRQGPRSCPRTHAWLRTAAEHGPSSAEWPRPQQPLTCPAGPVLGGPRGTAAVLGGRQGVIPGKRGPQGRLHRSPEKAGWTGGDAAPEPVARGEAPTVLKPPSRETRCPSERV